MSKQSGFTLIELMIVVAIIAILVSIAVPVYQDYNVRSRITEGLILAESAKSEVAVDGSTTIVGLAVVATAWNTKAGGSGANSKYVNSVLIDGASGMISIMYNPVTVGLTVGQELITLNPSVRNAAAGTAVSLAAAITAGNSGPIDWLCSSASPDTTNDVGMVVVTQGTVLAKYVPAQCR